jgi:Kdo2-lipid IVA lauroyltransferase/acyltransferase
MARKRSPIRDYLVYVAVRLLVCFVQMLSLPAAARLGRSLAWLLYKLDRRHRLVADDNLRLAFAELADDPARRDRLVRGVYEHFCTMLMFMVQLPRRYHINSWRRYFDMDQGRPLIVALLSRRPVLIVTGHFGNWELGGYSLGVLGFPTYGIARRIDNPHLDRFLARFRQKMGLTLLDKNEDYNEIVRALDAGGAVGTLGDQDAGPRGMFVEFFGRPASTHKAVAYLALQHDALMVVLGVPRVGPMFHRTLVADIIDPREYDGRSDAALAMTKRFTSALEGLIRQYPEQYFWLHRRWKHQPPEKKRRKAG